MSSDKLNNVEAIDLERLQVIVNEYEETRGSRIHVESEADVHAMVQAADQIHRNLKTLHHHIKITKSNLAEQLQLIFGEIRMTRQRLISTKDIYSDDCDLLYKLYELLK